MQRTTRTACKYYRISAHWTAHLVSYPQLFLMSIMLSIQLKIVHFLISVIDLHPNFKTFLSPIVLSIDLFQFSLSFSHSLPLSLSISHSLSLTLSLPLSLSTSLSTSLYLLLSLSLYLSLPLSLSLSTSLSPSLSNPLFLSVCLHFLLSVTVFIVPAYFLFLVLLLLFFHFSFTSLFLPDGSHR